MIIDILEMIKTGAPLADVLKNIIRKQPAAADIISYLKQYAKAQVAMRHQIERAVWNPLASISRAQIGSMAGRFQSMGLKVTPSMTLHQMINLPENRKFVPEILSWVTKQPASYFAPILPWAQKVPQINIHALTPSGALRYMMGDVKGLRSMFYTRAPKTPPTPKPNPKPSPKPGPKPPKPSPGKPAPSKSTGGRSGGSSGGSSGSSKKNDSAALLWTLGGLGAGSAAIAAILLAESKKQREQRKKDEEALPFHARYQA